MYVCIYVYMYVCICVCIAIQALSIDHLDTAQRTWIMCAIAFFVQKQQVIRPISSSLLSINYNISEIIS